MRFAEESHARVGALDGLRGIAALAVVLWHSLGVYAVTAPWLPPLLRSPLGPLVNGAGAPQLFFALSGFVLSASLARGSGGLHVVRFWLRRIFRIHPPYLAAIVLAWLASFVALSGAAAPGLTEWGSVSAGVHVPLRALLLSFLFPGPAFGQLPPGWSLRIELWYSLLMPALFLAGRRGHWLLLLALSGFTLEHNRTPLLALQWTLDFALGITLYLEREAVTRFLARRSAAFGVACVALALVVYEAPLAFFPLRIAGGMVMSGGEKWDLVLQGLGAVGLMACALGVGGFARLLDSPALALLGRVSYSVYLVHFPILMLIARVLPPPATLGGAALRIALVVVATGVLSLAGYSLVERPAIALGNAISRALARLGGAAQRARP